MNQLNLMRFVCHAQQWPTPLSEKKRNYHVSYLWLVNCQPMQNLDINSNHLLANQSSVCIVEHHKLHKVL